MQLSFPPDFFFGTSTASYQIETAFEHDWLGKKSRDGYVFERTSDHEKRFKEDAAIIAHCAPNYRMSLMWSKLQRAPLAAFDAGTVKEYKDFIEDLKGRGVNIMMVLHHFTNPIWFAQKGGWEQKENIDLDNTLPVGIHLTSPTYMPVVAGLQVIFHLINITCLPPLKL